MIENLECRRMRNRLNAYLDNELSASEKAEMERHAAECPECARMLGEYKSIHAMLGELDRDIAVPEEASRAWRAAVRDEAETRKRKGKAHTLRIAGSSIAAALVLMIGMTTVYRGLNLPSAAANNGTAGYRSELKLTADTAVPEESFAADYDDMAAAFEEPAFEFAESASMKSAFLESDGQANADAGAGSLTPVIAHSAERTIETQDLDACLDELDAIAAAYDGRFEYRRMTEPQDSGDTRKMEAVIRLPGENLEAFLDEVDTTGTVVSKAEFAEDISADYYGNTAKLATLEAQEERLNALLKEAETLEAVLDLEDKIYKVQYEKDEIEAAIADSANSTGYSGVTLTVNEVHFPQAAADTVPSLGERAGSAFRDSLRWVSLFLQDMVVALAAFWPLLILAVLVIAVICTIVHYSRKRRGRL